MLRTPSLEPVPLNVGGTLYTTNGETLTRFPDSMLGAMFRCQLASSRDHMGNLFIDRDGKSFRHILNYLRSSHLDLPQDYKEMQLLKREADFYQIKPLLEELSTLQQGRGHALLQCNLLSQSQTFHFNLKEGPQNYALSACSLTVHRARVFCTCPAFLALLCAKVDYRWPEAGERGGEEEEEEEPPSGGEGERAGAGCHLRLDWTPRPPGLPEGEYAKHGFRRLRTLPGRREVRDTAGFVEEILKLALGQCFRVDAIFPDPSNVLGCTALRFVRY
ncbi:BTB/POZ domain-containing protein KCTD21-like [Heptranchias perlo]|uniref:BTB/POZ domain-containing protein KCTD21-like n=1 Tax=Heptranchias perlo TaxID=212740 RepID=UPI0035597010